MTLLSQDIRLARGLDKGLSRLQRIALAFQAGERHFARLPVRGAGLGRPLFQQDARHLLDIGDAVLDRASLAQPDAHGRRKPLVRHAHQRGRGGEVARA